MRAPSQIASALTLLCLAGNAGAAPLDLILRQPGPDIEVGFLTASNTNGGPTNTFVANGFALRYTHADGTFENLGISFHLDALIDNLGNGLSGSMTIGTSPIKLHGNLLTAFGWRNNTTDLFEFMYHIDGGTLAPDFGDNIGIIMQTDAGSTFNGNWNVSFTAGSNITCDVGIIPEPGTFGLLVLALGLCVRRVRTSR